LNVVELGVTLQLAFVNCLSVYLQPVPVEGGSDGATVYELFVNS
jgi:hypothetical protein